MIRTVSSTPGISLTSLTGTWSPSANRPHHERQANEPARRADEAHDGTSRLREKIAIDGVSRSARCAEINAPRDHEQHHLQDVAQRGQRVRLQGRIGDPKYIGKCWKTLRRSPPPQDRSRCIGTPVGCSSGSAHCRRSDRRSGKQSLGLLVIEVGELADLRRLADRAAQCRYLGRRGRRCARRPAGPRSGSTAPARCSPLGAAEAQVPTRESETGDRENRRDHHQPVAPQVRRGLAHDVTRRDGISAAPAAPSPSPDGCDQFVLVVRIDTGQLGAHRDTDTAGTPGARRP